MSVGAGTMTVGWWVGAGVASTWKEDKKKKKTPTADALKKVFVLLRIGAFSRNCSVRDMFGKHSRAFDVNVVPTCRCGGKKCTIFVHDVLAILTFICLQVWTV